MGDDGAGACFVFGADEAVEKAHRDGGDAGRAQGAGGFTHGVFVERGFDAAVVAHTLGHFEAEVARDEHRRFVGLQVVEVRPLLAADLEQVAEAGGGDEAGADTAMLDQGVGGNGGAVAEIADGTGPSIDPGEAFLHAGGDAAGRVIGGGGDFPDLDLPGFIVEQAEIGECSSGVYSDAPGHWVPRCCSGRIIAGGGRMEAGWGGAEHHRLRGLGSCFCSL